MLFSFFFFLTLAGVKEEAGSPVDSKQEVFGVWWFGLCLSVYLSLSIHCYFKYICLNCISLFLPVFRCLTVTVILLSEKTLCCVALWASKSCRRGCVIFVIASQQTFDRQWLVRWWKMSAVHDTTIRSKRFRKTSLNWPKKDHSDLTSHLVKEAVLQKPPLLVYSHAKPGSTKLQNVYWDVLSSNFQICLGMVTSGQM